jgi:putative oxidoreductase
MSQIAQTVSSFLGRILLSLYFIWQGVEAIFHDEQLICLTRAVGDQLGPLVHFAVVAILVGGGLFLMLGYRARTGAFLLFAAMVTLLFCRYDPLSWLLPGAQVRIQALLSELGLFGGLLLLMAFGPGKASLSKG